MGTEVQPQETKVLVRRLNTRGHIMQYSMILQKSITRTKFQVESR